MCSCAFTMSMLCPTADAISSGSWPILFTIVTLNVTIWIVLLHVSNFCLCFSSVTDFSNIGIRAPTLAEHAPYSPARWATWFGHVVWLTVMVIFRWLYSYLINRCHPSRYLASLGFQFFLLYIFPVYSLSFHLKFNNLLLSFVFPVSTVDLVTNLKIEFLWFISKSVICLNRRFEMYGQHPVS